MVKLTQEKSAEQAVWIQQITFALEMLDIDYLQECVHQSSQNLSAYQTLAFIAGGPDKLKEAVRDAEVTTLSEILTLAINRKKRKDHIASVQRSEEIRQTELNKIRNII